MRASTFCLLGTLWAIAGTALPAMVSQNELIESGRRIYELGILPDGSPLQAFRQMKDEIALEGANAACINCHRRSGMGSVEGAINKKILIPPISGTLLFSPAKFAKSFLDPSHHYVPNAAWARAVSRPAYDEKHLARALRDGIDPAGKKIDLPMLRYDLNDAAMMALSTYLRQLSILTSPGVDAKQLHIATIITPDVTEEQSQAMLEVINVWTKTAQGAGKPIQLHVWQLQDSVETWQRQLTAFYQQQPVFAVLSGNGASQWEPVHRFCEQTRLPCILPSVEVIPEFTQDYYTIYYSPGIRLEAKILASFLNLHKEDQTSIIQVYSDDTGNQAATEFRKNLDTNIAVTNRQFRLTAPAATLRDIASEQRLLLWLRPAEISQLIASHPQLPKVKQIYLSSLLTSPDSITLPPEWKSRVHFVSLFDDLGTQGQIAKIRLTQWLELHKLSTTGDLRTQADAYTACYLFNAALAEIRSQEIRRPAVPLSRDHLLETLEQLIKKYDDGTQRVDPDSHVAFYGRMSLGPTQRIAVRGGSILRYAAPDSAKLILVSEHIVP